MSECQKDLMRAGGVYPRTCARCGLGPCAKGYPNDYVGTPPHPEPKAAPPIAELVKRLRKGAAGLRMLAGVSRPLRNLGPAIADTIDEAIVALSHQVVNASSSGSPSVPPLLPEGK